MDFNEQLKAKFPDMYENVVCGVWCPKGWEGLVVDLSEEINSLTPGLRVDQVKEKFGGLRFYYSLYDGSKEINDQVEALVNQAEEKSYTICQSCGNVGELRRGGWYRTLCQPCEDKYKNE